MVGIWRGGGSLDRSRWALTFASARSKVRSIQGALTYLHMGAYGGWHVETWTCFRMGSMGGLALSKRILSTKCLSEQKAREDLKSLRQVPLFFIRNSLRRLPGSTFRLEGHYPSRVFTCSVSARAECIKS